MNKSKIVSLAIIPMMLFSMILLVPQESSAHEIDYIVTVGYRKDGGNQSQGCVGPLMYTLDYEDYFYAAGTMLPRAL